MNTLRQRCLAREPLVGSFAAIPHPVAVEVMAASAPDFLCLDWEHAQFSRGELENLVRAADIHRVPALVRVPGHAAESIAAALDSGAAGILVPRVSTAAQAEAAVQAARFPPVGSRGVGPGRAAGYGYRIGEHLGRAAAETLVAVQVETAEGLANARAVAETEGVDLVFVGPGDLAVSLGALGPEGAGRMAEAIGSILRAAREAGKAAGIFCAAPEDAGRWAAAGASFFILGSDTMFLGAAAGQATDAARGLAAAQIVQA